MTTAIAARNDAKMIRREAIKAANALRDEFRGACSKPEAPRKLRAAADLYRELGLVGAALQCEADAAELEA